jgi:hypothetical protein
MKIHALFILSIAFTTSCASTPQSLSQDVDTPGSGREYILWSHPDTMYEFVTAHTPTVWFEGYDKYIERQDTNNLDAFQSAGIRPLVWRGGRTKVEIYDAPSELANYWLEFQDVPGIGISIDELGGNDRQKNQFTADALRSLHEQNPDFPVYVWNAGLFKQPLIDAFAETNAIPLLEIYTSDTFFLWIRFGIQLRRAEDAGILNKTIVALAIENASIREDRWSYSMEIIKKQMDWVIRHFPEVGGFAFFAPRADRELLMELNEYILSLE